MLQVYYGDIPERVAAPESLVYNTSIYFDNTYLDSWLEDPLCIRMIRSVDRSEVIGPHLIQSPVLGPIPPTSLSGGVKTLLLVRNDRSRIFNASTCGDNCAWWLLRIASQAARAGEGDVTVNLFHHMHFSGNFSIRVLNSGVVVHNKSQLFDEAARALRGEWT